MDTDNIHGIEPSEKQGNWYPNLQDDVVYPNSQPSTNLIYVSQQNLAPILQHLQQQQLVVFENLARQNNSSLVKIIVGIAISILLAIVAVAGMMYWYFQPVENAQKNIAQTLHQYQQEFDQQISQKMNELQKNYHEDIGEIHTKSEYSYQQILGFFQKLQKDYQQRMSEEENRKINLLQRQEVLEKTVHTLTKNLTTAEITILNLREENRKLEESQTQLKKLAEQQKSEILRLKKQMAEKLTPEELEKIKKDRQDDG